MNNSVYMFKYYAMEIEDIISDCMVLEIYESYPNYYKDLIKKKKGLLNKRIRTFIVQHF